jgi:hypothetical protein
LQHLTLVDVTNHFHQFEPLLPVSLRSLTLDHQNFGEPNSMDLHLVRLTNLHTLTLHGWDINVFSLPPSLLHVTMDARRHKQGQHHTLNHTRIANRFCGGDAVFPDGLKELRILNTDLNFESESKKHPFPGDPPRIPPSVEILYVGRDVLHGVYLPHTDDGRLDLGALRELHCDSVYCAHIHGDFALGHPLCLRNVLATSPDMPNLRELDLLSMTELPPGADYLDLRKYHSLEIVRCQIKGTSLEGFALLLPPSVHTLDTNSETLLWTHPCSQITQLILCIMESNGGIDSLECVFPHCPHGPRDFVRFMPALRCLHLRRNWIFMKQLAAWMPENAVNWSASFQSHASVCNPCFLKEDTQGKQGVTTEWSLFFTCSGCDYEEVKCEPRGKCAFLGHRFRGHDVTRRCRHQRIAQHTAHPLLCDACVFCARCVEERKVMRKAERPHKRKKEQPC